MGNKTTHWYILGAGSMGLLFARHFAQEHSVTLINKSQEYKPFTFAFQYGSRISEETLPIQPANTDEPIENLLICVKSHQTKKAIASIANRITADTTIVLLQNGLGNESLLLNSFPDNRIFKAITTEAAKKKSPNHIVHTGKGRTHITPLSASADLDVLSDKLHCELDIELDKNIDGLIWKKLIVNCVINPLTVIHDCLNGELLLIKGIDDLVVSISRECIQVATLHQVELNLNDCIDTVFNVIRSTAKNSSSMREDFRLNRKSEIDFISGFIVSEANKLKIAAPVNERLFNHIKLIENL